jgi:hypothetical protein
MNNSSDIHWPLLAMLAVLGAPASATVRMVSFTPTLASPQPIGATIGWTATATDTNTGPLTFQFNVAQPAGALATVKNFNIGALSGGVWQSQSFAWALTGMDGAYQVQVVAKDFTSGESAAQTVSFSVTSPVTGANPVVQPTQNPLVALFTAPSCAMGSTIRVSFQPKSGSVPPTITNWRACRPPASMTFEVAGMYPGTAYSLFAQVNTGGNMVNGPTASFTTGVLPSNVPFPALHVGVPDSSGDPNRVILHSLFNVGAGTVYPDVATDLSGNIIWYNYPDDQGHATMLTRPLASGFLAAQSGLTWDPTVQSYQVLRQFDWAGNIVRETNTGILQQQLLAMGNPDAGPCNTIPSPPPVGAACIGIFNHEAIQTLPNGYTAAIVDVERIFPAGTQGDTSGLPVDIVGDMLVVLDQNWNAVWYWDAFDPLGGGSGYPQLPVSRTAVLNEQCGSHNSGCVSLFLLGPGVAPKVHDWLHGNTIYYWPHDGAPAPSTAPGDLVYSARHQDWVVKIDYKDGAGTGNILWRMGPSGDFTLVNAYNDPWPWFSHQHEAGIENGGTGVFTVLDNGNTRISPPSGPGSSTGGVPGLGAGCVPRDCHSRGMALALDETTMQVTPVMNVDLGAYSGAMGSAQLLADGNYFFLAAVVFAGSSETANDIQIQPTAGTASGTQVLNISSPTSYRSWQMPSLYSPPTT